MEVPISMNWKRTSLNSAWKSSWTSWSLSAVVWTPAGGGVGADGADLVFRPGGVILRNRAEVILGCTGTDADDAVGLQGPASTAGSSCGSSGRRWC